MNTDWFWLWAEARHTGYQWPFSLWRCRSEHVGLWLHLGADLYWCRACYYHRSS